jgi:nitrous oxide reductase accessory protein NosL
MMKKIHTSLLTTFALVSVLTVLAAVAYGAEPKPAEIRKSDKCQVCGMFVSKYPTWIAQVIFKDGTYAAFDGPKDMFRFYFDVPKYNPSKKQSDIEMTYVTDYYTTKPIDARTAFFVTGSDVMGPMGPELVPLSSIDKAKGFSRDHRGRKILRFGEVTAGDLR